MTAEDMPSTDRQETVYETIARIDSYPLDEDGVCLVPDDDLFCHL